MFVVTEADDAAIRAALEQQGELSAAAELRRRFPGITDNALARECARTIAGWKQAVAAAAMPGRSMRRQGAPSWHGGAVERGGNAMTFARRRTGRLGRGRAAVRTSF
jgi:hypothetical protein